MELAIEKDPEKLTQTLLRIGSVISQSNDSMFIENYGAEGQFVPRDIDQVPGVAKRNISRSEWDRIRFEQEKVMVEQELQSLMGYNIETRHDGKIIKNRGIDGMRGRLTQDAAKRLRLGLLKNAKTIKRNINDDSNTNDSYIFTRNSFLAMYQNEDVKNILQNEENVSFVSIDIRGLYWLKYNGQYSDIKDDLGSQIKRYPYKFPSGDTPPNVSFSEQADGTSIIGITHNDLSELGATKIQIQKRGSTLDAFLIMNNGEERAIENKNISKYKPNLQWETLQKIATPATDFQEEDRVIRTSDTSEKKDFDFNNETLSDIFNGSHFTGIQYEGISPLDYRLNTSITYNKKDVSVETALAEILAQAGLRFEKKKGRYMISKENTAVQIPSPVEQVNTEIAVGKKVTIEFLKQKGYTEQLAMVPSTNLSLNNVVDAYCNQKTSMNVLLDGNSRIVDHYYDSSRIAVKAEPAQYDPSVNSSSSSSDTPAPIATQTPEPARNVDQGRNQQREQLRIQTLAEIDKLIPQIKAVYNQLNPILDQIEAMKKEDNSIVFNMPKKFVNKKYRDSIQAYDVDKIDFDNHMNKGIDHYTRVLNSATRDLQAAQRKLQKIQQQKSKTHPESITSRNIQDGDMIGALDAENQTMKTEDLLPSADKLNQIDSSDHPKARQYVGEMFEFVNKNDTNINIQLSDIDKSSPKDTFVYRKLFLEDVVDKKILLVKIQQTKAQKLKKHPSFQKNISLLNNFPGIKSAMEEGYIPIIKAKEAEIMMKNQVVTVLSTALGVFMDGRSLNEQMAKKAFSVFLSKQDL